MVRYNHNGSLDTSFGNNGIVTTSLGTGHAQAKNIVTQKDGKIIVTGNVEWFNAKKFTLVRYTTDGKLDETFGNHGNGIVIVSLGKKDDRSVAMALQNDGKLLVAGDSFNGDHFNFALTRLII